MCIEIIVSVISVRNNNIVTDKESERKREINFLFAIIQPVQSLQDYCHHIKIERNKPKSVQPKSSNQESLLEIFEIK